MGNCCYQRYCLLNPYFKCCFRYMLPITLEITYFICKLICVIFAIWGKAKFPWELYPNGDEDKYEYRGYNNKYFYANRKYLKIFYNIGFITGIIKLAFFLAILILRLTKLINGKINIIVLIFCYIIFHVDNIGLCLFLISIIIIISDFSKIHSDSHSTINLFNEYPAVLAVFIVYGIFDIGTQIPFMVDIQLIRFKTDLSYDEYKKQKTENHENQIIIIADKTTINPNNTPQGENITNQDNLGKINETQIKMEVPNQNQNNINERQNPQNK